MLCVIIAAVLSLSVSVRAQIVPDTSAITAQSSQTTAPPIDTLHRGDIDTTVVISARDTAHFIVNKKLLQLRGSAIVTFKNQKLEAEAINMDFERSSMTATGEKDSTGRTIGFPVFTDGKEEFAGEAMTYNFKTKRGNIRFGETSVEGGFYYGSRIKRVGERTAYIENGCFTTCDAPEPHFYFTSPRMKVVMDNKIFLDPVLWYVEDIPVFALPFGLFFSTEKGRRSGIIMPTATMSSSRGIVLQNVGYYFAISDYFDSELTADVTTKGGFTLYNRYRWSLHDNFNGDAELLFGYSRFNVNDPYEMNIGFKLNHQQQLRPQENLAINLFFTTTQLLQNTSLNPIDRVQQNARSTASYQRTFYNGTSLNLNYVRDENMITGSVTQTPSASFAVPQLFPLRSVISGDSWLRDLMIQYRSNLRYSSSQTRSSDTLPFTTTENTVLEHRPQITVTPKLGNVTLQPTVSYSENWYAQRYTQTVNPADSTVVTSRETGFYREFTYSAGVSASTFLYGMAYPHLFGIAAFRHTLQPTIGLTFTPDQSNPALGFFGEYQSPITGQTVRYRRYSPGGSLASDRQQTNLSLSLLNKFSIKKEVADTDSVAAKPIDVLTVNLSTNYNLAADSVQLSPITFSIRAPMLQGIEFACGGTFDPYQQAAIIDPATGRSAWTTVNTTMMAAGTGLARLTSINLQLGTRFSSQGVSFDQISTADTTVTDTAKQDIRSRFDKRINFRDQQTDMFADHTPGWTPVTIPWDASVSISYNYSRPNPDIQTESLLLSFRSNFSLTSTLRVSAYGSIDMLQGTLNTPVIDINKQVHCWNLSLNWVPLGTNQGFYLRFSASAPQLQGLIIPKQSTPLYR